MSKPCPLEDALDYLRAWFERHGSSAYDSADEWINSMSNVELLEAMQWVCD